MRTFLLLLLATACTDVENPDNEDEGEVITTVELRLTPQAGGDALTFTWTDPENDGDPVVDVVDLSDETEYDLSVSFFNALEDPPEDITPEIVDEADEHQVFFTGTAVQGPATGDNPGAVLTHAYADVDADGSPIGLQNTLSTGGDGQGSLVVTLRHLPAQGGAPVKTATLAEDAAAGGLDSLPGEVDAQVEFSVTVR